MRKSLKRFILWSFVILGALLLFLLCALYPQLSNMKSEYVTAGVISQLDKYVEDTGQWPKSWKDLGEAEETAAYTKFRFDLSVEAIRINPELIYESVTPLSGKYYTYPHARRDLENVLKKLNLSVP